MPTQLIQLDDGTLVEVEAKPDEVQPISGGSAKWVESTFEKIRPLLVNTCRPITAAWKELSQEMNIEQAEVELGLSFEGEGNIYVTKAKTGANLVVKLTLRPKE